MIGHVIHWSPDLLVVNWRLSLVYTGVFAMTKYIGGFFFLNSFYGDLLSSMPDTELLLTLHVLGQASSHSHRI